MITKITFLIITFLGLVHSFPWNYDVIKSLQQENSPIAQAFIQKIIVKRDDGDQYGQQPRAEPYSVFEGYEYNCVPGAVKLGNKCQNAARRRNGKNL
jgi:hypothetical protein